MNDRLDAMAAGFRRRVHMRDEGDGRGRVGNRRGDGGQDDAEFVDADVIARNLPRSRSVAITAGRAMLRRLDELGAGRRDFEFETTLASRSLVPRIRRLARAGYECHLVFLWLPNADLAVARVADRVRLGDLLPDFAPLRLRGSGQLPA